MCECSQFLKPFSYVLVARYTYRKKTFSTTRRDQQCTKTWIMKLFCLHMDSRMLSIFGAGSYTHTRTPRLMQTERNRKKTKETIAHRKSKLSQMPSLAFHVIDLKLLGVYCFILCIVSATSISFSSIEFSRFLGIVRGLANKPETAFGFTLRACVPVYV